MQLYKNVGSTEYDYCNDENFLIIAEEASGNEVVFGWSEGWLFETVFSNIWPDTTYTIIMCFQIWETPDEVSVRNFENWTDCEMEGGVKYQDVTSKVIYR